MNEQVKHVTVGAQVSVRTNKIILGHEQGDTPDFEPLFVNNTELLVAGSDFYMDLGILRPDEMTAFATAQTSDVTAQGNIVKTIDFYVLQRIAMSESTFRKLIETGRSILARMDEDRTGRK